MDNQITLLIIDLVVKILFVLLILWLLRDSFKYDNTDSKLNKKRSGFMLYTDYGTGNQYISTMLDFTGHKPRLDKDGKQVNIYTNPIKK